MPHIEVWQSKQDWKTAGQPERERVLQELRALVARCNGPHDHACGPYLHSRLGDQLLIWHVEPTFARYAEKEYERILERFFKRLMFGQLGDLTAKAYMDKLS